ncbi:MAG: dTDP-4-dehydrorhamnose reductase [Candidatus Aureabacteria bacterium]|nr:dTDP-4-dehydrorhamnose reductase [Candidatus Auribacterota bacterium]
MRRILITGASGFLGWNLARALSAGNEVWGTYHEHSIRIEGCRLEKADVSSEHDVTTLMEKASPEVVLHAAARIDVDLCEREREKASRVNTEGTQRIARLAAETGSRLIYFSTDMVFDGEKGMYTEEDAPRPINHYGETKLEGERGALAALPGAVIARLALMYGRGEGGYGSFLAWMLQRLKMGESVPLFVDQFRTPLYVGDVCLAVKKIIEDIHIKGIYHFAGPERVSRYEFGIRLAEMHEFSKRLLQPVRMRDLERLMPRPCDTSLDNRKAECEIGMRFNGIWEGLRAVEESGVIHI